MHPVFFVIGTVCRVVVHSVGKGCARHAAVVNAALETVSHIDHILSFVFGASQVPHFFTDGGDSMVAIYGAAIAFFVFAVRRHDVRGRNIILGLKGDLYFRRN